MNEITLDTLFVGEITGSFSIPSYQRGYRWGENEIYRLLDDIHESADNYCLQPIVLKKTEEGYEVIDGQQRLTSLYLIYKYFEKKSNGFIKGPAFAITYEIRNGSGDFLKTLDNTKMNDNIDFYHMMNAFNYIKKWFEEKMGDKSTIVTSINEKLDNKVKVIWYVVDNNEDSIALFTRLNIGKIPLTNAELVKAMFLSKSNTLMTKEKQSEIALQWDAIERELHNDSLWYFLANDDSQKNATRINLLLDLIVGKPKNYIDEYYTFFKFQELKTSINLNNVWSKINLTFSILKDWYEDHELYHKIGYLIASKHMPLRSIYDLNNGKNKGDFKKELDKEIKKSISFKKPYSELTYESTTDQKNIFLLLLLFNVESIRKIDDKSQRFAFNKFKSNSEHSGKWSLEHIHAQNSEGLNKDENKREWLKLHLESIKSVDSKNTSLISRIEQLLENVDRINSIEFTEIFDDISKILSTKGNVEFMHSLSNLALLNTSDNSALNNSTFDVKRGQIIALDKAGQYIPFCTKMVFLKYYTSSDNNLHFWSIEDRKNYIDAMNECLKQYLNAKISYDTNLEDPKNE